VLSIDDVLRIAAAHAHERYGDVHGLTKVCELIDPPGSHFAMLNEHGEALRTGDGGFFVSRTDGRTIDLGSGHFAQVLYRRVGGLAGELSEEELLREVVAPLLATERPNEEL
jgi:hypothetical protein